MVRYCFWQYVAQSPLKCFLTCDSLFLLFICAARTQRANFRQYFVCLRERIFNCCKVFMLSWSWNLRSNSGGYLRDYSPQWMPFFGYYEYCNRKHLAACGDVTKERGFAAYTFFDVTTIPLSITTDGRIAFLNWNCLYKFTKKIFIYFVELD